MFTPTPAANFSDELFLLDFSDEKFSTNPNPSPRRPSLFLQEFLDIDKFSLQGFTTQEGKKEEEEEEELEWLSNKEAFPSLETSFQVSAQSFSPVSVLTSALPFRPPAKLRSKAQRRRRRALSFFVPPPTTSAAGRRKCLHCESEETPQWRAGPDGPKTLCNACGVRFKSGRLVPEYRPANSPTFVAAIHSNSHRRIVEMRRRKYGAVGNSAASSGGGGFYGRRRRRLAVV